jgi:hypothetical protein
MGEEIVSKSSLILIGGFGFKSEWLWGQNRVTEGLVFVAFMLVG